MQNPQFPAATNRQLVKRKRAAPPPSTCMNMTKRSKYNHTVTDHQSPMKPRILGTTINAQNKRTETMTLSGLTRQDIQNKNCARHRQSIPSDPKNPQHYFGIRNNLKLQTMPPSDRDKMRALAGLTDRHQPNKLSEKEVWTSHTANQYQKHTTTNQMATYFSSLNHK